MSRKSLSHLNNLLASRLGRNPYGEGLFRWEWSEDLFWPEFPTGRMVSKESTVPIIGGMECPDCEGRKVYWHDDNDCASCHKCGGKGKIYEETVYAVAVPEYRREKMAPNLDRQWVITVWMAPEKLEHWQANFPGAPYPSRGHRIHTNASLPSYEGGPREPNLEETERFIKIIRHQRNHTHWEVEHGIDDERTARDASTRKQIEDEFKDDLPAQLNLKPGARGGWVSFPYSKKDLVQ